MADWLCDIVSGSVLPKESVNGPETAKVSNTYTDVIYPTPGYNQIKPTETSPHKREAIHPSPSPVPAGFEGAGAGRILTFESAQPLSLLIQRIGDATGWPGALSVAIPQGASVQSMMNIRTVGVCPGSGGNVIMKGAAGLPDLLFTGELSHHEALAAIERGSAVITLFHSNTERGYLHDVLRSKLSGAIVEELKAVGITTEEDIVAVSQADRDPYGVVVRSHS